MPDPDKRDGQTQTDTETHIKIKIVGENRVNGFHSRMPAIKDPVLIKNGIGHDRNDDTDQTPDDRPERQDHADKNQAQVHLNAGGNGRQKVLGVAGQLNPGNRNQLTGPRGIR